MAQGVTNTTAESKASCGHLMTGSETVFVNDGGMSRVNKDTTVAGGLIISGGSISVYCDDYLVSNFGDLIAPHPVPCVPPHCAPTTGGSTDVYSGEI